MIPASTVNDSVSSTVPVRSFVSPLAPSPPANNENDDRGMNDLIKINIGGKLFLQVQRSTLCQAPDDALFTRIFSKNPNSKQYQWQNCYGGGNSNTNNSNTTTNNNNNNSPFVRRFDEEGRIFLDHDPELLEIVVNFLRTKQIEDPSDPIVDSPEVPPHKRGDFRRLLNHFGLTGFFFYPSTTTSTSYGIASNSSTDTASSTTVIPSSFRSTTGRSIRSMSIDEEHEQLVVVYNDDSDDDDEHDNNRVLLSGVVSISKDSQHSHDSVSSKSGFTVDDGLVVGDNDKKTAVRPCPLGFDYCYG